MRILTRYILREYLIPLFYCLAGFLSIYVLFELFGSFARLSEADLPFPVVVEYFCAYLAPYFEWCAPAALMLAALYTMWSFCRHSEIIAMRASGISFMTIVKPVLAVALAMAAFVWWVNDSYVPRKAQWAQLMRSAKFNLEDVSRTDNIVYRNAPEGRTWSIGRLLDFQARELGDVRVTIDRPGGGPRLQNITAPRAAYLDGEWWFFDAAVQHYNSAGEEIASPVPALDALKLRAFPAFRETPGDFLMQNRAWAYYSIADRFRYLRLHTDLTEQARRKCRYETWAKIFSPLACLVITLFAIPAGIASGRQSVFKGIVGALALFFSFYGTVIACMVCANTGLLPPVPAALAPYVIYFAAGIVAFRKQR
jgi:lipopolysaccharide export system permease protein